MASNAGVYAGSSESISSSSTASFVEVEDDVQFQTRQLRQEGSTRPISVTVDNSSSPERPIKHRDVRSQSSATEPESLLAKLKKKIKGAAPSKVNILNAMLNELPGNIAIADTKYPPNSTKEEKKAFCKENRTASLQSIIQANKDVKETYKAIRKALKKGESLAQTPIIARIGYIEYQCLNFAIELKDTTIALTEIKLSRENKNELQLILNFHSTLTFDGTLPKEKDEKIPTVEELEEILKPTDDSDNAVNAEAAPLSSSVSDEPTCSTADKPEQPDDHSPPCNKTFKIALDLTVTNINMEFDPTARETQYVHTFLRSGIFKQLKGALDLKSMFQAFFPSESDTGYTPNINFFIGHILLQWIRFNSQIFYPKALIELRDFNMATAVDVSESAPVGAEAFPQQRQPKSDKVIDIGMLCIKVPEKAKQCIQLKPGTEKVVDMLLDHFTVLGLFGADIFVKEFIPDALMRRILPNYEKIRQSVEDNKIKDSVVKVIDFYRQFTCMLSKLPFENISMTATGITVKIASTKAVVHPESTSKAIVSKKFHEELGPFEKILYKFWSTAKVLQESALQTTHKAKKKKHKTNKHFNIKQSIQTIALNLHKPKWFELKAELNTVDINYRTDQPMTFTVSGIPAPATDASPVPTLPLSVSMESHSQNTAWPFSGKITFSSQNVSDQIEGSYDTRTGKAVAPTRSLMLNVRATNTIVTSKAKDTTPEISTSLAETHSGPLLQLSADSDAGTISQGTEAVIRLPELTTATNPDSLEASEPSNEERERLCHLAMDVLHNLKREAEILLP